MDWIVRPAIYRAIRTRLFVQSSMPKSASRFLRKVMEETSINGGAFLQPKITLGYGHNFLETRKVKLMPGRGRIFRLYGHTPLTEFNHRTLHSIDPRFVSVITIRPLPDIVVSYADHIRKYGLGPLDTRVKGAVEGNPFFNTLNDEQMYQYLIDFVMPWFSRYMASWLNWEQSGRLLIVRFDDIKNRPSETVSEIFEFSKRNGIDFRRKAAIGTDVVENFNQGLSGRGRELLTEGQIGQLRRQSSFLAGFKNGPEIVDYLIEGE